MTGATPKPYRDYLSLFDDHAAALTHADILVFPDRAIGPSAEQILMDMRANPQRSRHPWPSPGVYTSMRLAKALAKVIPVAPELAKIDLIDHWLTLWPGQSLTTLTESWDRVDTLLAFTTDPAVWSGVVADAQVEKDPEITEWLPAMVTAFSWSLQCASAGVVGSRWHYLQQFTRDVPGLSRSALITALERNPWSLRSPQSPAEEMITLHVPRLKNSFPLEDDFFRALEANPHCQVVYYSDPVGENILPDYEAIHPHPRQERPAAFVVTGGTRALTYTLLESEIAAWTLDLPAMPESPLRLELAQNPDHPLLEDLRELLIRHRGPTGAPIRDLLAAADFCGRLNENIAAPRVHPKWSAAGVPCISIDDAWALPRQSTCLVSTVEEFTELFDPLSRAARAKAPLPHLVQQLLLNNHVTIRHSEDETLMAQGYWRARQHEFTKWELSMPPPETFISTPPASPMLSPSEAESLATLSPSGIEELLSCAYKFYDQRVRRHREMPELDALTINALKRGEWLHQALEDFFVAPNFHDDISPRIATSLEQNLSRYFGEISSPAYLTALRKRIPKFAADLADYLSTFETALQNEWPQRTHQLERSHLASYAGLNLRGKTDRIDVIEPGKVLLWDYKSGGAYNLRLPTLLGPSHRKLQWMLYTKMVESSQNVQVVGGGYVQLLRPEKSGIYFYSDRLSAEQVERLQTYLPVKAYSVKFLNAKDVHAAEEEFARALELTKATIATKVFLRRPLKESLCQTCSAKVICGRPYFAIDDHGDAEGDA